MRTILLCVFLGGCYSVPVGTEACNRVYWEVYRANQWHGSEWARVYAHNAFEACHAR
jgi:hypothetical protein